MILGHERQIGYLNRAMERGRMSHAYFFTGPAGVGKRTIARAMAAALVCKNYRGPAAIGASCGVCGDCALMEKSVHPQVIALDLTHTLVSDEEKRTKIPIGDIRELRRLLALASAGGRWRVAIIDGADIMSPDAADALLKIMEEPGENTLFFLIADARGMVRSTLVSRAVPVGFSPVSDGVLAPFIRAHFPAGDHAAVLAASRGRPGMVIKMAQNRMLLAAEKKLVASAHRAVRGGIPEALAFASEYGNEEGILSAAAALIQTLRPDMVGAHPAARLRAAIGIQVILDMTDALRAYNVNPRMAMDAIAMEAVGASPDTLTK